MWFMPCYLRHNSKLLEVLFANMYYPDTWNADVKMYKKILYPA